MYVHIDFTAHDAHVPGWNCKPSTLILGTMTPAAALLTNHCHCLTPDAWVGLHCGPSSNLLEKGSWRWTIAAAIPGPVYPLPIFSEEMTRSTPSLSSGWLARFSKFGPCH